jgi:hypothetical protein
VVSFHQDIPSFAKKLPRRIKEVEIMIAAYEGQTHIKLSNMHVNGERVKKSLMFYIEHNIHYIGIEIDDEALEELASINRIISPHEMKQIIVEDKEKATLIENQEDD